MPKIKTCKAILKRFKLTGTNKILRRSACKNHLLRKKSKKQKRKLSKNIPLSINDNQYMKYML